MNKFAIRFLFSFILFLAVSGIISAQNVKEQSFTQSVKEVVQLLVNKDSLGIKKYIDKNTGVFLIFRPGVMDNYVNFESISFNDQVYPNFIVPANIKITKVKYGKLPTYSCENERWSKIGCYVDTTVVDHLLSNTAKNMAEYLEVKIEKQEIDRLFNLETISRKVVIVNQSGDGIVLYLSYIKNQWYLTIIDEVSDDCSA